MAVQVQIQADGRIQIPRKFIRALGWSTGQTLIIDHDGGELRLIGILDQIGRVQRAFANSEERNDEGR